jgi:hypothetical protein
VHYSDSSDFPTSPAVVLLVEVAVVLVAALLERLFESIVY